MKIMCINTQIFYLKKNRVRRQLLFLCFLGQLLVTCLAILILESWNYGMIWDGRNLKGHLVPIHGQGLLPLAQVTPSPIQPGMTPN